LARGVAVTSWFFSIDASVVASLSSPLLFLPASLAAATATAARG
jgi:hypothetical protein